MKQLQKMRMLLKWRKEDGVLVNRTAGEQFSIIGWILIIAMLLLSFVKTCLETS